MKGLASILVLMIAAPAAAQQGAARFDFHGCSGDSGAPLFPGGGATRAIDACTAPSLKNSCASGRPDVGATSSAKILGVIATATPWLRANGSADGSRTARAARIDPATGALPTDQLIRIVEKNR